VAQGLGETCYKAYANINTSSMNVFGCCKASSCQEEQARSALLASGQARTDPNEEVVMDRAVFLTVQGDTTTFRKQFARPKRLILLRHGQSEGNLKREITKFVPDHALHLTELGTQQALQAGESLKAIIGDGDVEFIHSPYVRTVETLNGVVRAFGGKATVKCKEDAYIREQDFGNFDKEHMKQVHKEKNQFGKFYFRFPDGESPADVYNRAGIFLESLYRRWETQYVENVVIVSHELFIIVFLMRMFRLPVQEYYALDGVPNCGLVVLERPEAALKFDFSFTWMIGGEKVPGGIKRKPLEDVPEEYPIWNGDPASPPVQSNIDALGRTRSLTSNQGGA